MSAFAAIEQLIGNTPLIRLGRLEEQLGLKAQLFAKAENLNPSGSGKDRIAREMIRQAEISGQLKPGGRLVEASSGNTGISLAMLAAARGYGLTVAMPAPVNRACRQSLRAFGAELVLTLGEEGLPGAMAKALEIARENPDLAYMRQFENPANLQAHYGTTGPEIERDTGGQIDVFVAGVGTGGTITGAGRFLKARHPNLEIVAVEPAGSPVLSGGQKGRHRIRGIGFGFVPEILDLDIFDQVITVYDLDAVLATRLLAKYTGLMCGISSGAALYASVSLAKQEAYRGQNIVLVLPDSGFRYLSDGVFDKREKN